MGIEVELLVLLIMSVVGQSTFARFEIEAPAWRATPQRKYYELRGWPWPERD